MGDALTENPLMSVTIHPATPEQAQLASAILTEAAQWLERRGIPLWSGQEISVERLRPIAERGELYLAFADGDAAGTMILQENDTLFWPDEPAGESLFLHKLAIRRAVAGRGVAASLVAGAAEEARRRGKRYLRLDCDASRPPLHAFYQGAGFTLHSERQMGHWRAALYQRDL